MFEFNPLPSVAIRPLLNLKGRSLILTGNAAKRDHRSLKRIAWYAGLLLVNEGIRLSLRSAEFFAFCDSFSLRPVPTAVHCPVLRRHGKSRGSQLIHSPGCT